MVTVIDLPQLERPASAKTVPPLSRRAHPPGRAKTVLHGKRPAVAARSVAPFPSPVAGVRLPDDARP